MELDDMLPDPSEQDLVSRRSILKAGALSLGSLVAGHIPFDHAEAAPSTSRTMMGIPFDRHEKVRLGIVGVGLQGTSHLENFLKIRNVEIKAVCDIVPGKVERAQEMALDAGAPKPDGYSGGPEDFRRLCDRPDIDLVFNVTPWEWHVPVCLDAMNKGKHAAVEVPIALSTSDCWQLVRTSERTRRHCIMMENCNYDKVEMMILNMVKKGVLGELLHCEGGYLHDLRDVKHDMEGEGAWRRAHSMKRNGDLYPTHGLGPLAQCLDINRGNMFEFLVSVGTPTKGLHKYAVEHFGPDSPQARERFVLNDVVTTLIKTKRGETIILKHDTSSPRPYSRDILVQGTNGIIRKYPETRVHIEGRTRPHTWEPVAEYMKEFIHPVWRTLEEQSKGAGHGGMDFIEDFRLIDAMLTGREPDMDVYDGVSLSVISELSGKSIGRGSQPIPFPDFASGGWKQARSLQVMNQA